MQFSIFVWCFSDFYLFVFIQFFIIIVFFVLPKNNSTILKPITFVAVGSEGGNVPKTYKLKPGDLIRRFSIDSNGFKKGKRREMEAINFLNRPPFQQNTDVFLKNPFMNIVSRMMGVRQSFILNRTINNAGKVQNENCNCV